MAWVYEATQVTNGELELSCGHEHKTPDDAAACAIKTFDKSYHDSYIIIATLKVICKGIREDCPNYCPHRKLHKKYKKCKSVCEYNTKAECYSPDK